MMFSATTPRKNKEQKGKQETVLKKQHILRQVRSGLRHRFQGGDTKGRESVRLEPASAKLPAK